MKQSKEHVATIFADLTDSMLRSFRGWEQDLPHAGERGGIRERRVSDFLARYLPKRYGIGTGHIIDNAGKLSGQTDIVIYDQQNGVVLPIDDYYSLFPAECVYATVEVKSRLTASQSINEDARGELYRCSKGAAAIESLDRQGLPPIESYVFAYSTQWSVKPWEQIARYSYLFGSAYNMKSPELLLVLDDPGFLLSWYRFDGQARKHGYSHLFKKNPLLCFLSEIIKRLSRSKSSTPDLWQTYGNWLSEDVIAEIFPEGVYRPFESEAERMRKAESGGATAS